MVRNKTKKERGDNLVLLGQSVFDRLPFLSENDFSVFVGIARAFFAEYLKLKPTFSYEEASSRISTADIPAGLKKRVSSFFEALSIAEYSGTKVSSGKFSEFKRTLHHTVKQLLETCTKKHRERAKSKHITKYIGSSAVKTAELVKLKIVQKVKASTLRFRKAEHRLSRIEELINEITALHSAGQSGPLKEKYGVLMINYASLPDVEKKRIFERVAELHRKLTGADKKKERMEKMLTETSTALNSLNTEDLKRKYAVLYSTYLQLPASEQKKAYQQIMETRSKIQSLLSP